MPDIENSRKTAEKGAEWVAVKQPKNSRNTRKTVKTAVFFSGVSAVLPAVFRLFYREPLGAAVFRLFSMPGIWHLCRWPQIPTLFQFRCTPKGSYGNTAFQEGFWEGSGKGSGPGGIWGRVLKRLLRKEPVKKGSQKGSHKGFWEGGFQKVPRTPPWGVRPLRHAPCQCWRPPARTNFCLAFRGLPICIRCAILSLIFVNSNWFFLGFGPPKLPKTIRNCLKLPEIAAWKGPKQIAWNCLKIALKLPEKVPKTHYTKKAGCLHTFYRKENLGHSDWSSFPCLFGIPCFFLKTRNSLSFWAFFPSFPRILGVRLGRKFLAFSVVFLAFYRKSKERKIRAAIERGCFSEPKPNSEESAFCKRGACKRGLSKRDIRRHQLHSNYIRIHALRIFWGYFLPHEVIFIFWGYFERPSENTL